MADNKSPTYDEPTDLRLTADEYDVRHRRHQRFSEMLYALRREYMDRCYEEEQVRRLIHLHENETWRRGDGEWWNRSRSLLDRLHRIGVEQLHINGRIANLSTLAASMAAAEDAQKMADQAMEAARRANASYVGPRTEVWWQREEPPPPPYLPCVSQEGWENYYQYGGRYGDLAREEPYEEYLEYHPIRNRAAALNDAIQVTEQEALERQVYHEDDVDVLLRAVDEEEDPVVPTSKVRYI